MSKRAIILIGVALCACHVWAQESAPVVAQPEVLPPDFSVADPMASQDSTAFAPSQWSMPPVTSRGTIAHYPYFGSLLSGSSYWVLHPGLNASLSASAIFSVGRHGGSGFANSLSLMYADTITSRLSFAIGGYYSTLDWNGRRYSDAGLSAMLSYRFDEHWEATLFAHKSLMQPCLPMQVYWMDEDIGDKIGASVRYHFNPAFSIGVSVWSQQQPAPFAGYGPPPPMR